MNIMNMPGFGAESSLYKANTHYPTMATNDASLTMVVPQIPLGLCTKAAYYCSRGYQKWCDIEDRFCNVEF